MTHYDDETDPSYFDDLNQLPSDSYAGRERDLCDLLTADTIDWLYTLTEYYESDGLEREGFTIFLLLMMNPLVARAMTEPDEIDDEALDKFISQIQDDARDDSGEVFTLRLRQRLQGHRRMIRFTADLFPMPPMGIDAI